jgi:hypothetical protein
VTYQAILPKLPYKDASFEGSLCICMWSSEFGFRFELAMQSKNRPPTDMHIVCGMVPNSLVGSFVSNVVIARSIG